MTGTALSKQASRRIHGDSSYYCAFEKEHRIESKIAVECVPEEHFAQARPSDAERWKKEKAIILTVSGH